MKKKYLLLYVIIGSFVYACTDDSEPEVIPPLVQEEPSSFEVKIDSVMSTGVVISWSESFDPQEQSITYDLFLENEMVESGLSARTYKFTELNLATAYSGYINAKDSDGNTTTADFSFTSVANASPSTFEIESISSDNISAVVQWTKAIDPEEEAVSYTILLDGEMKEEGYLFEILQLTGLKAATEYSLQIIASDVNGNQTNLNTTFSTANGIYDGDVSFSSQQGVDFFGNQGYIQITGNLTIRSFSFQSDITDLSALHTLKEINGHVDIENMNSLVDLSGFHVEKIGKYFRIKRNRSLVSLKGLDSLKTVLGGFEIEANNELNAIDHLNNLETVGNHLSIKSNYKITRIESFNKLSSIRDMSIYNNITLERIIGFQSLKVIDGNLRINDNFEISVIDAFTNLARVGGIFFSDTKITNINNLSSLIWVGGDLSIEQNPLLQNIDGLSAVEEIEYGSLYISTNPEIINLDALTNLHTIGATLSIGNNTKLSDFCGLRNAMQGFVPSAVYRIINNQYNPTIEEIANGQCKL
ncbi:MAG: hypothetical protein Mars2KO_16820 [Maribacter sp.]